MTTPGEVLAGAVARHVASRDAMTTLAAEIEAERAEESASSTSRGAVKPPPAPPPPPGG